MTTPTSNAPVAARLARARVLLIGVGGIGSPAALALGQSGVGTIGLVDPDVVEVSNLHRQPLYEDADLGRPKVEAAAERLQTLFPGLRVTVWRERFPAPASLAALPGWDVVIDGTDSIAAKFDVNDAAVAAGVPLVHAGVLGFRGQMLSVLPGVTACYRCVFEEAPPAGDVPTCEEAGILGPTVALAGALAAAEAIRIASGTPAALADRLLAFDLWGGGHRRVPLARRPSCPTCASAPNAAALGSTAP